MKKFVASGSGFGSCREGPRLLHAARLVIGLGVLLLASISAQVYAQTLTTLASFNGSNGENPYASVTLSGNTLYGTTDYGGVNNVRHGLQRSHKRRQPHGAGLVQRQQRRRSRCRFDAQWQHPVWDDRNLAAPWRRRGIQRSR